MRSQHIFYRLFFRALLTVSVFFSLNIKSQVLTLEELIQYPRLNADDISEKLVKKGWHVNSLEFVTDSHFVRRTWMIPNSFNDLKSYVLFYDFVNDKQDTVTLRKNQKERKIRKRTSIPVSIKKKRSFIIPIKIPRS
ncbi:MAG: hypothetical protein K0S12_2415 [Bacteroidetes bacterium]|nr:hypothetical protein [Bacteroidota bacterium]